MLVATGGLHACNYLALTLLVLPFTLSVITAHYVITCSPTYTVCHHTPLRDHLFSHLHEQSVCTLITLPHERFGSWAKSVVTLAGELRMLE